MSPAQEYRRLPGRSGFLIRHSLWMQSDHLLRVRGNPFSQQYRRYYFADIQGLVITELPGTAAYYWYAAALSLFLMGGWLAYSRHLIGAYLTAIAVGFAFYLGRRVPNCTCYLKTSVGTDKLPAIRNLRTARKAVAMLISEIEKVQGPLSRETLDSHAPGIFLTSNSTVSPVSHYSGVLHWFLFGLMLFHGGMSTVVWFLGSYSTPVSVVSGSISAGIILLAILAAFKQHRTDMSQGVRWVVYDTLVLYALDAVASFAVSIYVGIQIASKGLKAGDRGAMMAHPAIRVLLVADLSWYLVVGCLGLILMWLHQRATHTPPPLDITESPGVEADGT
jgi:hypothetical protein